MLQDVLSNQAVIIERLNSTASISRAGPTGGGVLCPTGGGAICPVITLRRAVDLNYDKDSVLHKNAKDFDSEADRKRAKNSLLVARQLSSYFGFEEQHSYSQLESNDKDTLWKSVFRELERLHDKSPGFFDTMAASTFYSHYMKKQERVVVRTP